MQISIKILSKIVCYCIVTAWIIKTNILAFLMFITSVRSERRIKKLAVTIDDTIKDINNSETFVRYSGEGVYLKPDPAPCPTPKPIQKTLNDVKGMGFRVQHIEKEKEYIISKYAGEQMAQVRISELKAADELYIACVINEIESELNRKIGRGQNQRQEHDVSWTTAEPRLGYYQAREMQVRAVAQQHYLGLQGLGSGQAQAQAQAYQNYQLSGLVGNFKLY